jgi:predicted phage terminase large subunit-like protein
MSLHHILNEGSISLKRAIVDEVVRSGLVPFTRVVFEIVAPGERLHLNWHVHAIAHALEQVRQRKLKRLIITVPPRHLKSVLSSVAFPAFVLGHNPATKILCASYSAELAIKHNNDFRAVMRSECYRRQFPGTQISSEKNNELELMTTKRGGRFATSVGGTVTGRGGNIIILDDPMKPDDGLSEALRQRAIDWYQQTLLSRLNSKREDAIIVVMQRIHVDDLVGILLEAGGWHHLDLPAIADCDQDIPIGYGEVHRFAAGDVLDPVREPREVLDAMKASMGSMAFSAQYLQRPIPAEGNLIRREWLRYYQIAPQPAPEDLIVISLDTAMKPTEIADYSVGTVWMMKKETYYLLDLVRGRFDYPTLRREVLQLKQRWPDATILIEDKGSGTSLIQDLRYQNISVIDIKAETDKVTRLCATQALFEAGSVLFPQEAPWLQDLVIELMAFPKYRHDDQVDSMSQGLTWMRRRPKPEEDGELGMPISVPNYPRWDRY